MLKKYFWISLLFILFFLILNLSQPDGLAKGQTVKQFYSFAITESLLTQPFSWLSTHIPCPHPITHESPITWVSEPPLFNFLAVIIQKILNLNLNGFSITFPIISFLILLFGFAFHLKLLVPRKQIPILLLFSISAPIFVRYSFQHIPDLFAVALLVWALYFFKTKNWTWFFIFGALASFSKTLMGIPLFFIFALIPKTLLYSGKKGVLTRSIIGISLFFIPFILWGYYLKLNSIPNPFHQGGTFIERYIGDPSLYLSLKYWMRYFTWLVFKGVGPIIFCLACFQIYQNRKKLTLLNLWALSSIPAYLFIPNAHFIHDYYFLVYAPAFVLLACERLNSLKWNSIIKTVLVLVSFTVSVIQLYSMKVQPYDQSFGRPQFCEKEIHETEYK